MYDTLLTLNSNDLESLIGKGDALFMMKRYQEALTIYEQVLSIDKNNLAILKVVDVLQKYLTNLKSINNKFSLLKLKTAKKDLLIKSLKKLQIILAVLLLSITCYLAYIGFSERNNINGLVRAVEISRLSKNFEKALSRTDEIILLFPTSDIGYKLKVDILFELDRYDESIVYIDKLIAINKDDINVYKLKGIALGESDQKSEAVEHLNIYLSAYPNDDFIVMYRDKLQKLIDNKNGG